MNLWGDGDEVCWLSHWLQNWFNILVTYVTTSLGHSCAVGLASESPSVIFKEILPYSSAEAQLFRGVHVSRCVYSVRRPYCCCGSHINTEKYAFAAIYK